MVLSNSLAVIASASSRESWVPVCHAAAHHCALEPVREYERSSSKSPKRVHANNPNLRRQGTGRAGVVEPRRLRWLLDGARAIGVRREVPDSRSPGDNSAHESTVGHTAGPDGPGGKQWALLAVSPAEGNRVEVDRVRETAPRFGPATPRRIRPPRRDAMGLQGFPWSQRVARRISSKYAAAIRVVSERRPASARVSGCQPRQLDAVVTRLTHRRLVGRPTNWRGERFWRTDRRIRSHKGP